MQCSLLSSLLDNLCFKRGAFFVLKHFKDSKLVKNKNRDLERSNHLKSTDQLTSYLENRINEELGN